MQGIVTGEGGEVVERYLEEGRENKDDFGDDGRGLCLVRVLSVRSKVDILDSNKLVRVL